ncbi:hypothetical protein C2845_PM17G08150 [Panicum miliaceum]|uniref:HAT C-terminal dimerisation domain-containing protein n=1 Tax=Panicum miliaceum TaxID=4540 RepID=A0A3L6Q3I4_PANMI|nr:hypothetical protein C2845_PM17G08150 [Panicum miliaceum]
MLIAHPPPAQGLLRKPNERRIVGFKHMEFPDDVVSVAETIALCISELKVDKKVISITLDNDTLDNEFYKAVLDPRYKLNLIRYCFRKLYGEADGSQHVDRVIALLHRVFTEYEKSSLSVVGFNVVEYHAKDDLFDDYTPQEQRSELDWYLESPTMDLNIDLDILEFWSAISKCYPDLANMARDILDVPISTVPSKSAFNTQEKVLNPRRGTLKSDLLEMLMSLHDWTCPKDRNGIAVSAIEEYYSDYDEEEDEDFADLEESVLKSHAYDEDDAESIEEFEDDEDIGNDGSDD